MSNQPTTFTVEGRTMTIVGNKAVGKGAHGAVHLVKDPDGKEIVMKVIKNEVQGKDGFEFFSKLVDRETNCLKRLDHPHIVKYEGGYIEPYIPKSYHTARVFMEYCPQRDIGNYFGDKKPLKLDTLRKIFFQIVSAIAYCHHGVNITTGKLVVEKKWTPIFHRDIKSGNVLVASDDLTHFKLCDLGVSKEITEDMIGTLHVGTGNHRAPETFRGVWTTKADIYALGHMARELSKTYHLNVPNITSKNSKPLTERINRCTLDDPKDRPSFGDWVNQCISRNRRNRPSSLELLSVWNTLRDSNGQPTEKLPDDLFFNTVINVGRIKSSPDNIRERLCLLMEDGGDKAKNYESKTPLEFAIEMSEMKLIERLKTAISDMEIRRKTDAIMDEARSLITKRENDDSPDTSRILELASNLEQWGVVADSPLHKAARGGEQDVIEILLEARADVDTQNERGETALLQAALFNHAMVVDILLDGGADVNAHDNDGATALHKAAGKGHLEVIKELLGKNPDVNAQDHDGTTALHKAADKGHLEIVEKLLNRKADVNAHDHNDTTALHKAAEKGHLKVVKELLGKKADVNAQDRDGSTALHKAADKGHLEVAKELLGRKTDVNAQDRDGTTAHHKAANKGHLELVEELGKRGAKANPQDRSGKDLRMAAWDGDLAGVQDALSKGVDVNLTEKILELGLIFTRNVPPTRTPHTAGLTPLQLAAERGHAEVVKVLLAAKANVNHSNDKKLTALHLAALHGRSKVLELLLREEVNINKQDLNGKTALHLAVEGKTAQAVGTLLRMGLDLGLDLNARDSSNRTPLHRAAYLGDEAMVRLLLDAGADITLEVVKGETGLKIAAKNHHYGVEEMMEAHQDTSS